MKIHAECVPCLLKRILFEVDQSTKNKELKDKVLKKCLNSLTVLYDSNSCSATIATKIHKLAYDTLGDIDPYRKLKKLSNEVAKKIVPRVDELIYYCDDPIRMAMLCSIVGNMMDFGIDGASSHPDRLMDIFEEAVSEDFGHDDTEEVKDILNKSKKVVLFTDNCGEVVFDKILCREIKKFNPKIFLTLVVKGEYILSDATMDDVRDLGFDNVADKVLTTGCFAVGVNFDKIPVELKEELQTADIIICKGMANFESFSETAYRPIAYLLRTKCKPIADSIGISTHVNAVKLYP
jgi:uncharacterized protein with ATP-grasp and redox domains